MSYAIEPYAHGVIVADYSGDRGTHGAAYAGLDGIWHDMPLGLTPFPSEIYAQAFINTL